MQAAILFDCEFLTAEGAQGRFWCGPSDPDPTVVQIGAVRLGLVPPFPVMDRFAALIRPTDRQGATVPLDPVFTRLTGISEDMLATAGRDLASVLADFAAFAGGARLWSWGKDEINLMAISPYIAGLAPPIPAARFGNACNLLLRAGVPCDVVQGLRSHTLCAHFGLTPPEGRPHDAAFDALSLATVIRHLLQKGSLSAPDLAATTT